MPQYDFKCENEECDVDICSAVFGMNEDEKRKNFKCPECGGDTMRIYSSPSAIVKGSVSDLLEQCGPQQTIIDCDGQPVRLNFIEHKDPKMESDSILQRMPGARIDESTGKPVVDVVSDIPDPLGHLERSKAKAIAEGRTETEVKNVNQKVKTRKAK